MTTPPPQAQQQQQQAAFDPAAGPLQASAAAAAPRVPTAVDPPGHQQQQQQQQQQRPQRHRHGLEEGDELQQNQQEDDQSPLRQVRDALPLLLGAGSEDELQAELDNRFGPDFRRQPVPVGAALWAVLSALLHHYWMMAATDGAAAAHSGAAAAVVGPPPLPGDPPRPAGAAALLHVLPPLPRRPVRPTRGLQLLDAAGRHLQQLQLHYHNGGNAGNGGNKAAAGTAAPESPRGVQQQQTQQRLQAAERELAALRTEYRALLEANSTLETQLDELRKVKERGAKAEKDFDKERKRLQQELDASQAGREKAEDRVATLQKQLREMQKHREQLLSSSNGPTETGAAGDGSEQFGFATGGRLSRSATAIDAAGSGHGTHGSSANGTVPVVGPQAAWRRQAQRRKSIGELEQLQLQQMQDELQQQWRVEMETRLEGLRSERDALALQCEQQAMTCADLAAQLRLLEEQKMQTPDAVVPGPALIDEFKLQMSLRNLTNSLNFIPPVDPRASLRHLPNRPVLAAPSSPETSRMLTREDGTKSKQQPQQQQLIHQQQHLEAAAEREAVLRDDVRRLKATLATERQERLKMAKLFKSTWQVHQVVQRELETFSSKRAAAVHWCYQAILIAVFLVTVLATSSRASFWSSGVLFRGKPT